MKDKLIRIWQSSNDKECVKLDKFQFLVELQSNLDYLNKSRFRRYLRGILGAILLIPIFGYMAYSLPAILLKIGAISIALSNVYIVIRLTIIRKKEPAFHKYTYIDYLCKTREHLKAEKKILALVIHAYTMSVLIGIILFLVGHAEDMLIGLHFWL